MHVLWFFRGLLACTVWSADNAPHLFLSSGCMRLNWQFRCWGRANPCGLTPGFQLLLWSLKSMSRRLSRSMGFASWVLMICGRVTVACCLYLLSARFLWHCSDCNLKHAWSACPVLKHGPRSLTCARVIGNENPKAK